MKRIKRYGSLLLVMMMVLSLSAVGVSAADYYFTDRQGVERMVPDGAFAAEVISYTPGNPWTSQKSNQDPNATLGEPDYVGYDDASIVDDYTLGTGGDLILRFNVNIFDDEGEDIYIFEVGPDVEPTEVYVSNDLKTWYDVGKASGSTSAVDLHGKVPEGSRFRYVKLVDLGKSKTGRWPGADIDAVAGLNTRVISSNWSEPEIDRAEELNLIPECLKGQDMTQSITRLEFAAVSVKTFEALNGTKAIPSVVNPFVDCNDTEMLKAYNLGITIGVSDTEFAPNLRLNREQAATMLTRVFKRSSIPGWSMKNDNSYKLQYKMPPLFADDARISFWARDSVYFMAANNIIKGMGGNIFAPNNYTAAQEAIGYANATREQALLIAVRMVDNLR